MSGRISWEGWAVPPGHEAAGHGQEGGQRAHPLGGRGPAGKVRLHPAPKIHIVQQDGDYYNVMPCIYERGNIAMVKMIGRHSHQQRIMDLFREDPNVHFVLCDTYEEVIGGSDLVFAANIYGRAAVPDTPYRYSREKYFI